MRVLPLISLLLLSCASLSPAVRQQLRDGRSFVLVRAPTPMIEVPVHPTSAFQDRLGWPLNQQWVPVNVRSLADGADPAEVLAVALTRRLNTLGYSPRVVPGVRVRFENTPQRWPTQSGVTADWVLHAQVDDVALASPGRPQSLRGSATLFSGDAVELRTTCSVDGRWPKEQLSDAEAWIELLKRCAKELLQPFEQPQEK